MVVRPTLATVGRAIVIATFNATCIMLPGRVAYSHKGRLKCGSRMCINRQVTLFGAVDPITSQNDGAVLLGLSSIVMRVLFCMASSGADISMTSPYAKELALRAATSWKNAGFVNDIGKSLTISCM